MRSRHLGADAHMMTSQPGRLPAVVEATGPPARPSPPSLCFDELRSAPHQPLARGRDDRRGCVMSSCAARARRRWRRRAAVPSRRRLRWGFDPGRWSGANATVARQHSAAAEQARPGQVDAGHDDHRILAGAGVVVRRPAGGGSGAARAAPDRLAVLGRRALDGGRRDRARRSAVPHSGARRRAAGSPPTGRPPRLPTAGRRDLRIGARAASGATAPARSHSRWPPAAGQTVSAASTCRCARWRSRRGPPSR